MRIDQPDPTPGAPAQASKALPADDMQMLAAMVVFHRLRQRAMPAEDGRHIVRNMGLDHVLRVIVLKHARAETCTSAQLVEECDGLLSRWSLMDCLRRAETAGLIVLEPCQSDRRGWLVHATDRLFDLAAKDAALVARCLCAATRRA